MAAIMDKLMAPVDPTKSSACLSAAQQAEADTLAQQVVDAWRRRRTGG